MKGLQFHRSSLNRVWRALPIIAICVGLLAPPLGVAHAVGHNIGLVTDANGVADMGYNYLAHQGLLAAVSGLGITGTLYEPADDTQYGAKLQQCVDEGNELCFAVGFAMVDAAQTAAAANPGTNFAVLDGLPDSPPPNLRGIRFDEKQAGYLAGALAGKMTLSGVIGVVGGMQIPPVVAFVEGYRNGAQCVANGANVLMSYTGTFTDPDIGAAAAADLISRGADVIFGAAGLTGNGAILYSAQQDVWSIGVDTDQYLSVFGNGTVDASDKLLSSAMKRLDMGVYHTIEDQLAGTFSSGTVTYGLAEDGVGLAPFHETDGSVPQATKDYLDAVEQGIISGGIDFNYACAPRFHAEIIENDVFGVDWLPNISVTLTIDDPGNGVGVDFTDTKPTNMNGFVMFDNLGGLTLAPDMLVTMAGGALTKTHTITNLKVDGVDAATDTVWGTGPVGAFINVQYCDGSGCSWRRFPDVQPDGSWIVDFSVPGGGTSPEEQNLLDIVPGMRGEALQPDEDADHTDYQWYLRNPTFAARFPEEDVHGYEWPLGASVTVSIDDLDNGVGEDYTDTQTVIAAPWNPDMTWVQFPLPGFDLQIGQEISMTDGATTKTHTVSKVAVTAVSLGSDTVAGIVEAGAEIQVVANCGPGGCAAFRRETGSGTGAWLANFSVPGGDGDEQATTDIVAETGGEVRAPDNDGDNTTVQWQAAHAISGNAGIGGATLSFTGGTPAGSAPDGSYTIIVPTGWSGTVTPSMAGHTFTPPSRSYAKVVTDRPGQNYRANTVATFYSVGTQDGWVLESTETSGAGGSLNAVATTFNLGDSASDQQYRAVLSFNTTLLPESIVIIKAQLKIRSQGVLGTNPFNTHNNLMVDVKKGAFSNGASLQLLDFNAAANGSGVGAFGKVPASGWYTATLSNLSYPYIHRAGTTQFRLRFAKDDNDDLGADVIRFYSGNFATMSYRPVLRIEYYVP